MRTAISSPQPQSAWHRRPLAQDAPPLTEAERAQAIQEIQDMRARISAIENRLGISPPPPTQYTPAAPRRAKDHNLELYGFVQLDAIQDFKRVNPRLGRDPEAIAHSDRRRAVRRRRPVGLQRPPVAARRQGDRHSRRQTL